MRSECPPPVPKAAYLLTHTEIMPAGKGQVLLQFEDTPTRKLATAITFATLALIALLLLARLVFRSRKRS